MFQFHPVCVCVCVCRVEIKSIMDMTAGGPLAAAGWIGPVVVAWMVAYVFNAVHGYRQNRAKAQTALLLVRTAMAGAVVPCEDAPVSESLTEFVLRSTASGTGGAAGLIGLEARAVMRSRQDLLAVLQAVLLGPGRAPPDALVLEAALESNGLGGEFALLDARAAAEHVERKEAGIWFASVCKTPPTFAAEGLKVLCEHPRIATAVLACDVHAVGAQGKSLLREVVVTGKSPYPKYPHIVRVAVHLRSNDAEDIAAAVDAACGILRRIVQLARSTQLGRSLADEIQKLKDAAMAPEIRRQQEEQAQQRKIDEIRADRAKRRAAQN